MGAAGAGAAGTGTVAALVRERTEDRKRERRGTRTGRRRTGEGGLEARGRRLQEPMAPLLAHDLSRSFFCGSAFC